MHEYALVEDVLEQAEGHRESQGASVIKSIVIRVGDSSGYSEKSLRQAYYALRNGTKAEGADLTILRDQGDSVILESLVLES